MTAKVKYFQLALIYINFCNILFLPTLLLITISNITDILNHIPASVQTPKFGSAYSKRNIHAIFPGSKCISTVHTVSN
jgi:hypothetical protein